MKAYAVIKTFTDGEKEGVIFTSESDASDALSGECNSGSTLAVEWCENYGGEDDISMIEIEI